MTSPRVPKTFEKAVELTQTEPLTAAAICQRLNYAMDPSEWDVVMGLYSNGSLVNVGPYVNPKTDGVENLWMAAGTPAHEAYIWAETIREKTALGKFRETVITVVARATLLHCPLTLESFTEDLRRSQSDPNEWRELRAYTQSIFLALEADGTLFRRGTRWGLTRAFLDSVWLERSTDENGFATLTLGM